MKSTLKRIHSLFSQIWQDESGQGATEYILMLVVVVAIIAIFRKGIEEQIRGMVGDLVGQIDAVMGG